MALLLCYKLKYPDRVFLLRGNHETAAITKIYGFYDECKRRYNVKLWKTFCDLFNCLPLAAVVAQRIFCCHGGLSPHLESFEQIRGLARPSDVPDIGLMADLLWADPSPEVTEWGENERGVSYVFGAAPVRAFLKKRSRPGVPGAPGGRGWLRVFRRAWPSHYLLGPKLLRRFRQRWRDAGGGRAFDLLAPNPGSREPRRENCKKGHRSLSNYVLSTNAYLALLDLLRFGVERELKRFGNAGGLANDPGGQALCVYALCVRARHRFPSQHFRRLWSAAVFAINLVELHPYRGIGLSLDQISNERKYRKPFHNGADMRNNVVHARRCIWRWRWSRWSRRRSRWNRRWSRNRSR